ncbi:ATPase H+ transporting accessory protein 1 like a isoform X2 [Kryptolebias marmoratus]|uniref:ATPase H+ transporting accessory protein 1 like a isoform X2 n=1 Tax=Kryptolebias marmoratus TaxID=37003 RepID=UPI0007F93B9D|nr:ATPase H+ transporting accessory protein 1 like a isoform X2 [Kryptolebias marmoratus]
MASLWKHACIFLLLHLWPSTCLHQQPADSNISKVHGNNGTMEHFIFTKELQNPHLSQRKLLQTAGAALPFPPLKVLSDGEPCVLFQARKVSLRYEKQKPLDLTELAFSPQKPADTSQSVCRQDRASLVMRFGDVDSLRDLSLRLQLSNTFYESSGQWWFSMDNVTLLYNTSEEAVFNATDVYAPASFSYRCLHVSSLQRYSGLLQPSADGARRWSITFIDFQRLHHHPDPSHPDGPRHVPHPAAGSGLRPTHGRPPKTHRTRRRAKGRHLLPPKPRASRTLP